MFYHNFFTKTLIVISALTLFAFSYNGKVIDEKNLPIKDVAIIALNSGQSTASLDNGAFSISPAQIDFRNPNQNTLPFEFYGGYIKVTIANKSQLLRIRQFDLSGRLLAHLYENQLSTGVYNIKLKKNPSYTGISLLQVIIGSNTYILHTLNLTNPNYPKTTAANQNNNSLLKQAANFAAPFSDTLLLIKEGYISKRIIVNEPNKNLGNLKLYDTTFVLSPSTFPKIDGSTTNVPLARIMACKFFNTTYTWTGHRIIPSNAYWDVIPDSTNKQLYNQIIALTAFSKTPQSYDSLIAGTRDIIFVASEPSYPHIEAATTAGFGFDIQPFAMDALLMVVNKDEAITGITKQNIVDIYTKAVTNWQEVGGPDQTIYPYQREATSGSQELINKLVMYETNMEKSIPLLYGMMSVFERLHTKSGAISYTPFYYNEYQMRDSLIRALDINGIVPNKANIYSGSYPLNAPVLVVTRTNLSDTTTAAKLRDWILAPQGQQIVEESGYAPLRPPIRPVPSLKK